MKHPKKMLVLLLATALLLSIAACGLPAPTAPETDTVTEETVPTVPVSPEEIPVTPEEETPVENTSSDSAAWREFLADYEAWVDSYIVYAKKVKENPTDMTALMEYSNMMADLSKWSADADALEDDLSAEEVLEYSAELSRIVAKLADVAY